MQINDLIGRWAHIETLDPDGQIIAHCAEATAPTWNFITHETLVIRDHRNERSIARYYFSPSRAGLVLIFPTLCPTADSTTPYTEHYTIEQQATNTLLLHCPEITLRLKKRQI